jgi:tRNA 2-selenouridine synthase
MESREATFVEARAVKCTDADPRRRPEHSVDFARLDGYDEIIDARSPAEYADDHLPGAINLPVLNDEERARVGTLHKQVSAFDARKVGAALVSRNIADHLERHFADKPRGYRPLVYCWRGGNRSGSFVTVLRAIGWNASQLEGGYKTYRRHVIEALLRLPAQFQLRVLCGPTGVGKSRLLRALAEAGAQVLDLEDLAAHMGSVLGAYPDRPQPSQKMFETRVWRELSRFDPARPVFVESESRKIGRLQTPDVLLQHMRSAPCLSLRAETAVRVQLLKEEYAHFLADGQALVRQLDCLLELQGRERILSWQAQAKQGDWDRLVAELLEQHYDPAYARSLGRNYAQASDGPIYTLASAEQAAFNRLARSILA